MIVAFLKRQENAKLFLKDFSSILQVKNARDLSMEVLLS